jgi:hypothetical protein
MGYEVPKNPENFDPVPKAFTEIVNDYGGLVRVGGHRGLASNMHIREARR